MQAGNDEHVSPKFVSRRTTTVAALPLIVFGALALLVAVYSDGWYTRASRKGVCRPHLVGVGLMSLQYCSCDRTVCLTTQFNVTHIAADDHPAFLYFGVTTYYLGLANVLLLGVCALLLLFRRGPSHLFTRAAAINTLGVLIAGVGFLAKFPNEAGTTLGLSAYLFFFGVAAATVGSVLAWRPREAAKY